MHVLHFFFFAFLIDWLCGIKVVSIFSNQINRLPRKTSSYSSHLSLSIVYYCHQIWLYPSCWWLSFLFPFIVLNLMDFLRILEFCIMGTKSDSLSLVICTSMRMLKRFILRTIWFIFLVVHSIPKSLQHRSSKESEFFLLYFFRTPILIYF